MYNFIVHDRIQLKFIQSFQTTFIVGIILLTLALFVSARMGIYQEVLYKKHGKYAHEALYITVRNLSELLTNRPSITITFLS